MSEIRPDFNNIHPRTTLFMKVVYIQRRPLPNRQFSIEASFDASRRFLPADIEHEVFVPHFESRGLVRRLLIMGETMRVNADVTHITGDIHFAALALRGSHTVLTIHDCGFLHRTGGIRRFLLEQLWYTLPASRVAAVTTISPFTRDELLQVVPQIAHKIHVVPTCISPMFQPMPKPEISDPPVILHVGTKPNKNLERVAAALAGVRCVLWIVGVLSEQQQRVLRENGITYTSHVAVPEPELLRLYTECDVVSFPSTYEGFGMPILEAQSVGRAVVTSNIEPLIGIAGEGACRVDPCDVSAIRDAFLSVLKNPGHRSALVEAGFANRERFSATKVASEYASLYRALL